MEKELESECRDTNSEYEDSSNFIEKMKLKKYHKKHKGENNKNKIIDRKTRCEEKKHATKVKCNKKNEKEVHEFKKKEIKSKREELREELRKGSGKGKRNDTKEECDKLVENIKMKQQITVTLLRESMKSEDFDTVDIEDKLNEKCEFEIKNKEIEE